MISAVFLYIVKYVHTSVQYIPLFTLHCHRRNIYMVVKRFLTYVLQSMISVVFIYPSCYFASKLILIFMTLIPVAMHDTVETLTSCSETDCESVLSVAEGDCIQWASHHQTITTCTRTLHHSCQNTGILYSSVCKSMTWYNQ